METITKINPHIHTLPPTDLNGALPRPVPPGERVTQLNEQVSGVSCVRPGDILCGFYRVESRMEVPGGEADLYLCTYADTKYTAKIYRRNVSVKDTVAEALKTVNSPWVCVPVAGGDYRGRRVEILPYYPQGSLRGKTYSFEQLKNRIIPSLNEGIKALHDAGILHKDLKPSNIMILDEELHVAIIDFGISSVLNCEATVLVTQTGMTPEYCAPETFKGLFTPHSDYYSLGMTLYELFCGKTPYAQMQPEEIEKYLTVQRLPFPESMPGPLQDLIRALTYPDISNRRNKENPNRRWGYDEVRNWLMDIPQTIPGEGIGGREGKPYIFHEREYSDLRSLVRALAENWSEGKKHLFRGLLTDYFEGFDPRNANICREAEQEAVRLSGKDDLIFWKTLCLLNPGTEDFFWKGKIYPSLSAFGRELLERLREGDYKLNSYLDSLFREEILSRYAALRSGENHTLIDAVKALESGHFAAEDSRQRKVNYYLTAYMLSGQRVLHLGNREFFTTGELTAHMRDLLGPNNQYLDRFRYFCHLMVDRQGNLVPELESWLLALGKQQELEIWRRKMRDSRS